MKITIYRHPGYFGRAVPLDVCANGKKVALLPSGTTQAVELPASGADIKVEMHGTVSSQTVQVGAANDGQHFECGTPLWVLLDVFSFCYLPALKPHVFFLRRSEKHAS